MPSNARWKFGKIVLGILSGYSFIGILPQVFSSKPENNHCIQIETSKSHLKRFWLRTCSPLKRHCCQNKNRGVENENNWTIELFSSLTLPIPNVKITCWMESRGNETHGGRRNETLFWCVMCENAVWCSLLPLLYWIPVPFGCVSFISDGNCA